jgi:hypothetical protein
MKPGTGGCLILKIFKKPSSFDFQNFAKTKLEPEVLGFPKFLQKNWIVMLFNFQSFKNLEPRFSDFQIAETSGSSWISKILQRRNWSFTNFQTETGGCSSSKLLQKPEPEVLGFPNVIRTWNRRFFDVSIK